MSLVLFLVENTVKIPQKVIPNALIGTRVIILEKFPKKIYDCVQVVLWRGVICEYPQTRKTQKEKQHIIRKLGIVIWNARRYWKINGFCT